MATNEQLQQAKILIQSGRKKEAAVLLRRLVKEDDRDYRPWLYLAMVMPPTSRERCIEQAEAIAPNASGVKKGRVWLERQKELAPPSTPAVSESVPDNGSGSFWVNRNRLLPLGLAFLFVLLFGAGWFFWASTGSNKVVNSEAEGEVVYDEVAMIEPSATATVMTIAITEETATAEPTMTTEPVAHEATPAPTTVVLIQPKQIAADLAEEPRAQWTATPVPSPTPSPTPTIEPTFAAEDYSGLVWPDVGIDERWVDVNLTTQRLIAFEGRTPVLSTAISSGRAPYYTVTGQFRIYYRLESQTMDGRRLGFDYVTEGVPHVQYFYGDFALHGAYWHNNFGQPMSHGCVNLSLPDAEWLYGWADYGMLVNVHY